MNLMELASQMLASRLGTGTGTGNLDQANVQSALDALLGGADGQLDLGSLVAKFSQGDLASLAQSWLGDGANAPMAPDQVASALGEDRVGEFASRLGIDRSEAASGLSDVIPELIDRNSRGGSLLDSVGGADALIGMASKLFR